jgi:hypothetical protein
MVTTLRTGDAVPHFEATRLDGQPIRYASIWQHKDLVLVTLPEGASSEAYASALAELVSTFDGHPAELVVTRSSIPGLPVPGALVADRWGEIFFTTGAARVEELPPPSEIVEWLRYVQVKCPECEGEAR